MGLDEGPSFIQNMVTIVNWGGIPADTSDEITEVLRYHVDQMKLMDKTSPEFMWALQAAKAMDAQIQRTKVRESVPKDMLWVPEITVSPLGRNVGEPSVSSDTSSKRSVDSKDRTNGSEGRTQQECRSKGQ